MNGRDWDADWTMCKAATPGPCHIERYHDFPDGLYSAIIVLDNPLPDRPDDKYLMIVIGKDREEVDRDASFYAEARSALSYWLQRVKGLEAEIVRMRAVVEAARRYRNATRPGAWPRDRMEELQEAAEALDQALAAIDVPEEANRT